jgi:hypothetical protein
VAGQALNHEVRALSEAAALQERGDMQLS